MINAFLDWVKARGKLAASSKSGKIVKQVGPKVVKTIASFITPACAKIAEEVYE